MIAERDQTQLRFPIGSRVECNCGEWKPGTVVKHFYRQSSFAEGMCAPYQVRLDDGKLIFAPSDCDRVVRMLPVEADDSQDDASSNDSLHYAPTPILPANFLESNFRTRAGYERSLLLPPAERAAAEEVEQQRFMFMGINTMNITDVPADVVLSLVAWHVVHCSLQDVHSASLASRSWRDAVHGACHAAWLAVSRSPVLPPVSKVTRETWPALMLHAKLHECRLPSAARLRVALPKYRLGGELGKAARTGIVGFASELLETELGLPRNVKLSDTAHIKGVREYFVKLFLEVVVSDAETAAELSGNTRRFLGYFLVKQWDEEELHRKLRKVESRRSDEHPSAQIVAEAMHECARAAFACLCALVALRSVRVDCKHTRDALGVARISMKEHGATFALPMLLPEPTMRMREMVFDSKFEDNLVAESEFDSMLRYASAVLPTLARMEQEDRLAYFRAESNWMDGRAVEGLPSVEDLAMRYQIRKLKRSLDMCAFATSGRRLAGPEELHALFALCELKDAQRLSARWRIVSLDREACTALLRTYDGQPPCDPHAMLIQHARAGGSLALPGDEELGTDQVAFEVTFEPSTLATMRPGVILTADVMRFTNGLRRVCSVGYAWPTWYAEDE
jgi:hypothetical protein